MDLVKAGMNSQRVNRSVASLKEEGVAFLYGQKGDLEIKGFLHQYEEQVKAVSLDFDKLEAPCLVNRKKSVYHGKV